MDLEQKKSFAVRLAKLREERNLTQQELADETKILRVTIAKYESQKRIPSFEDLTTLAKYFDTTTDYFLGLTSVARIETPDDKKIKIACDYTGLSEEAVKELSKEKNYTYNGSMNILSWLISNDYAFEFSDLLYSVGEISKRFKTAEKEYQEKYEAIKNLIENKCPISTSKLDDLDMLSDNIDDYYLKVDEVRYNLIQFTEDLANVYDNRKQSSISPRRDFAVNQCQRIHFSKKLREYLKENTDNGEHNPKNE